MQSRSVAFRVKSWNRAFPGVKGVILTVLGFIWLVWGVFGNSLLPVNGNLGSIDEACYGFWGEIGWDREIVQMLMKNYLSYSKPVCVN